LFVGAPAAVGGDAEAAAPVVDQRPSRPATLAPLEADLAEQLMLAGIVIRGHDIARVVSLMAGKPVSWEAEEAR
jgi:hypothetical protein